MIDRPKSQDPETCPHETLKKVWRCVRMRPKVHDWDWYCLACTHLVYENQLDRSRYRAITFAKKRTN